ncbi:hypothetical protein AXG93_3017s1110 [Marchantia polymorpha subsp. ruderalis]|uniref:Uncharacterized protein n=1 Tax=Marchantia polymorpha subsp. ruderalis TaxID=1480154 RepID=A0A176WIC9_MARPO|nr:hypothetical protein AXG93_3017s1110 [Marchantia polymorpha subsp. ruderalis]
MASDLQEQKKAQALAYDYEGDSKWIEYWANVLMPEDMAAKPEVRRHYQLKYYQRHIDPELKLEGLSIKKKPSTSTRAEPERPVHQGTSRPRSQPTPTPAASGPLRLDRQTIQFLANAWGYPFRPHPMQFRINVNWLAHVTAAHLSLGCAHSINGDASHYESAIRCFQHPIPVRVLIMAILALFPFLPRGLGDRAYRFTLWGTAVACGHSLYSAYGAPRSWNWQGLQAWLQSIIMGADFLHLLYCIAFASSFSPIKYAVVPVACRALEQVVPYLKRNFNNTTLYRKFLAKPCALVEANTVAIRSLSANVEVGLGFLLIFMVVTPQRNLVQTLVYWQLLKLKYQSPTSSTYHRNAWTKLSARVMPLIHRFAPFLQTPIGFDNRLRYLVEKSVGLSKLEEYTNHCNFCIESLMNEVHLQNKFVSTRPPSGQAFNSSQLDVPSQA